MSGLALELLPLGHDSRLRGWVTAEGIGRENLAAELALLAAVAACWVIGGAALGWFEARTTERALLGQY